uniref:Uncharacterized protein n=1 Tax=Setaria digitata TaxID=48799 RepID=A0A915Q5F9_9BILA
MNLWSSTSYMGTGHRALFIWLLLLLSLVFLVVYLDDGLDGEPSIFFVMLAFFDILSFSTTVVRIMRHYQICGVGRRQYDMNSPYPVTAYIYPLEKRTSVVVFEYFQTKIFSITGIQSYFRSAAVHSIKIWHYPNILASSASLVVSVRLDHRTNSSFS